MIICNTTFSVPTQLQSEFITYMREEYVPTALKNNSIKSPRLSRVHNDNEEGGHSFAFEFGIESLEVLEKWNLEIGMDLYISTLKKFEDKVPGFTTVLHPISL